MPQLFCIGMGYTARYLAPKMEALGWHVSGTHRQKGDILYTTGQPSLALKRCIGEASHLLISVAPDSEGCPVYRDIASQLSHYPWIGYLSTTGVYGDHRGEWVDETSATIPTEPRSLHRLNAERQWQAAGAHIFRLAGIYGEGRNSLEQLQAGTAQRIEAPGHYVSRIHVEDSAACLEAAMQAHLINPEIFNLADDEPCPAHEVVAYAASLLGIDPPATVPLDNAELSAMARSFYAANRRVSNRKIKEKLKVQLSYPSYREGLQALYKTGTAIA